MGPNATIAVVLTIFVIIGFLAFYGWYYFLKGRIAVVAAEAEDDDDDDDDDDDNDAFNMTGAGGDGNGNGNNTDSFGFQQDYILRAFFQHLESRDRDRSHDSFSTTRSYIFSKIEHSIPGALLTHRCGAAVSPFLLWNLAYRCSVLPSAS
ncbi:hypothetical protein F5Y03DRAFT_399875 [Xylaria venustula]|nr:hypothetical protein F5Y03DRAFT_399875 [Xylaria venustula]